MVLSGTLREFILADVFQLLAQQKITGKLLLNNGHSDGIVTFKDGLIISAEKENAKLSSKLYFYLIDFKAQPVSVAKEYLKSYEDNINDLSSEIIKNGIMSKEDMISFAETTIEDITCSLFQWKSGTYNFNSFRSVDSSLICDVVIPVENIVMEAMRRVDEWNRMNGVISEETIFLHTDRTPHKVIDTIPNPIKFPEQFISSKIDGTTPVKDLLKNSCLTEYKIYESLNSLLQSGQITALSSELSTSVQAAIKRSNKAPISFSLLISIIVTAIIIAFFILLSNGILKNVVLSTKTTVPKNYESTIRIKKARQSISIANLYYRTQNGTEPSSIDDLKKNFLLYNDDFYIFNLNPKLQYK